MKAETGLKVPQNKKSNHNFNIPSLPLGDYVHSHEMLPEKHFPSAFHHNRN